MKMLNDAERDSYAAHVASLTDAEFEDEVANVCDRAAHCPVFCADDQRASVLHREADRRPGGDALYRRGHARMRAGVYVERAVQRGMEMVDAVV